MSWIRPGKGNRSFALKLALYYALFFGLIATGGVLALYNLVRTHTQDQVDQELVKRRDEIALAITQLGFDDLSAEFHADSEAYGRQDYFIRLLDRSGRPLASSDTSAWPRIPSPSDLSIRMTPDATRLFDLPLPDARGKARVLMSKLGPDSYLQIGISLRDNESFLANFEHYALIILGSMLTLGVLIGWWLAHKAMGGVEAVTETAASIAGGHFAGRVEASGYGREIDELVSTFNHMAQRVQTVMEQMRQVNDNIAHDLRSPMTRIRGLAEAGVMNGSLSGEGAELAGSIVEECDRLIQMINTMLDISEAEAGVHRLERDPVDLTGLVSGVVELFQDVAAESGIRLVEENMPVPAIQGDRRKLQRVLANLLDNAVKYTPPGGEIRVMLGEEADRLTIRVQDTGSGISAEDLPHIFERFYRGDRSRALPGNGLGLCLARAIMHAHGGGLNAESRAGQGSLFTLWLPRPPIVPDNSARDRPAVELKHAAPH